MAKNISVPRRYEVNGEEKTTWTVIGKLFENEGGKLSGVINAIPTNWDGRFYIFEEKTEQSIPGVSKETKEKMGLEPVKGDLPF